MISGRWSKRDQRTDAMEGVEDSTVTRQQSDDVVRKNWDGETVNIPISVLFKEEMFSAFNISLFKARFDQLRKTDGVSV